MNEMIKIKMTVDEWVRMERHHEIMEEFLLNVEGYGLEQAKNLMSYSLDKYLDGVMEFEGGAVNENQDS